MRKFVLKEHADRNTIEFDLEIDTNGDVNLLARPYGSNEPMRIICYICAVDGHLYTCPDNEGLGLDTDTEGRIIIGD